MKLRYKFVAACIFLEFAAMRLEEIAKGAGIGEEACAAQTELWELHCYKGQSQDRQKQGHTVTKFWEPQMSTGNLKQGWGQAVCLC